MENFNHTNEREYITTPSLPSEFTVTLCQLMAGVASSVLSPHPHPQVFLNWSQHIISPAKISVHISDPGLGFTPPCFPGSTSGGYLGQPAVKQFGLYWKTTHYVRNHKKNIFIKEVLKLFSHFCSSEIRMHFTIDDAWQFNWRCHLSFLVVHDLQVSLEWGSMAVGRITNAHTQTPSALPTRCPHTLPYTQLYEQEKINLMQMEYISSKRAKQIFLNTSGDSLEIREKRKKHRGILSPRPQHRSICNVPH